LPKQTFFVSLANPPYGYFKRPFLWPGHIIGPAETSNFVFFSADGKTLMLNKERKSNSPAARASMLAEVFRLHRCHLLLSRVTAVPNVPANFSSRFYTSLADDHEAS
jgi:hypothetical protein